MVIEGTPGIGFALITPTSPGAIPVAGRNMRWPFGQKSPKCSFHTRMTSRGVVVAPGSFFGEAGEGYFRLALVPTLDECQRAVEILEGVL